MMAMSALFARTLPARTVHRSRQLLVRFMSESSESDSRNDMITSSISKAVASIKSIQDAATLTKQEQHILRKPSAPGPEDCCMSGCVTCVWDLYEDDMQVYKATKLSFLQHKADILATDAAKSGLSPEKADEASRAARVAAADFTAAVTSGESVQEIDPGIRALRDMERQLKRDKDAETSKPTPT